MHDIVAEWSERIRDAAAAGTPLRLRGGGSKDFYGNEPRGEVLDTRALAGVVEYEPTELMVAARAGTPLAELEHVLAGQGQMLPFEPPHFGAGATLGGCVAAGLSGPRRATAGSVRDYVLGTRVIDGTGRELGFGGRVMKNVAGYDAARLMVGALGTLGVITEVALKVLPLPPGELTLRLEIGEAAALETVNRWAGQPLPISATCHVDGALHVRVSGAEAAVRAARSRIGGDEVDEAAGFWRAIREHEAAFFADAGPLWRLSVASTAPPLGLGPVLAEWNGAQRWLRAALPAARVRDAARAAGGHATLFRGGDRSSGVFQPLPPGLHDLHRRLQRTFDPAGILNPGRLYAS